MAIVKKLPLKIPKNLLLPHYSLPPSRAFDEKSFPIKPPTCQRRRHNNYVLLLVIGSINYLAKISKLLT